MRHLTLTAPAKVNLLLRVLGKRSDGYHELFSLICPLAFGDELQVTETTGDFELACDVPEVPTAADSLLARAFRYAVEATGYSGGLKVSLHKRLPIGAGLGGGSSNAAAILKAVASLAGHSLGPEHSWKIAQGLGADIPVFLLGRPAWVRGIGEACEPWPLLEPFWVILIFPRLPISTAWVYQRLKAPPLTSLNPPARFRPPLERWSDLLKELTNDLESVVFSHYPVLEKLKGHLKELGADTALMSGSGSTVFGLFSQEKKRDDALGKLKKVYPDYWIVGTEPLSDSGVVQWQDSGL